MPRTLTHAHDAVGVGSLKRGGQRAATVVAHGDIQLPGACGNALDADAERGHRMLDHAADGFVLRVEHPVQPPHVDYRLTPLGREVGRHVRELGLTPSNLQRLAARLGLRPGTPPGEAPQ